MGATTTLGVVKGTKYLKKNEIKLTTGIASSFFLSFFVLDKKRSTSTTTITLALIVSFLLSLSLFFF